MLFLRNILTCSLFLKTFPYVFSKFFYSETNRLGDDHPVFFLKRAIWGMGEVLGSSFFFPALQSFSVVICNSKVFAFVRLKSISGRLPIELQPAGAHSIVRIVLYPRRNGIDLLRTFSGVISAWTFYLYF